MTFPLILNQGQNLSAPSTALLANNWQTLLLFNNFESKLNLKTDFAKQFGDYANLSIANNAKSLVPSNPLAGAIQLQTPPLKQSFTEKFLNSKWGLAAGMAGSILASSYDLIPTMDKIHNSNDLLAGDLRKNISSTLMTSGNPYAMAAGFATMGIDKLGGFADASKGLGGGNDLLNTVSSIALPGAGWFASTTDKYTMSDTLAKSSSYTGAADKSKTAMLNAGANILFGFSRALKMIREAKRRDNMVQGIISDAEDRTSAAGWYGNELRNWMDLNGGMERTHLARLGMKLPSKLDITKVREILAKGGKILSDKLTTNLGFSDSIEAEFPEETEVPEFKDGGQLNVIPEGALHARKNNMEGAGKDFTHKGIPVIDKDGEQQAEIERDEIIFRKEVTVKLEELRKDGSDKAAIEAGKLLVEEIFHNTDDRTGLIAEITGEAPELTESGVEIKAEGGKANRIRKYKTYKDLKDYLGERGSEDNYDLEGAYNDDDVYFAWEDEESKNPGNGHWPDTYKLPNHPTFSTESKYSKGLVRGGEWSEDENHHWTFKTSPYVELLHTLVEMFDYLRKNEPNGVKLIYKGKSYDIPSQKEGGTINEGGLLEELNKLSPEKLKEFQNILKYLNQ